MPTFVEPQPWLVTAGSPLPSRLKVHVSVRVPTLLFIYQTGWHILPIGTRERLDKQGWGPIGMG